MNVRKRIICNLLCFMIVLCSVFTFTACDKECKHKWGEWQTATEATCTSAGKKQRQCSKCKEFEEDIIQIKDHTFGEWVNETPATCSSAGTKAHKDCTVCEKHFDENGNEIADLTLAVNANAHSYGDWTSNGDGTHTRVCANNSDHTETENCAGGEATCEEKAVCSKCEEEYGNFGDHTFGEWVNETPATCSSTGTKAHKDCIVCEKHFDENDEEILDLTIEIDEDAHSMTTKVVDPTCTEQGYTTHYCQNEPCEYSYNDTYVEANGHSWDGEATCTEGIGCLNCDETKPELGHNHELLDTFEATCTEGAYEYYKCSRCEDNYIITISESKGHNITGVTPTELHIDGCEYQYVYKCSANNCGEDVKGDIFYKHTFKATIDKEATCTKTGLKILTCESCGHIEEETIEINENGHIWDEGTLDTTTNIKTFHCINKDEENNTCSASYTAIDASNTNSAGVSSSDLTLAGGGVKLESAELEFDNTALGALENKDLIISSEILSGEDLDKALAKLTENEREQLSTVAGQDPVIYNFTVAESSNPDSLIETFNDGYVTVRLPYTPNNEDIDSVAVWYISGGKPVAIEATYSNGYITFKTNHFSEYTVTRLLPEERCALYGCVHKETVFNGTCTQDAYILKLCIRCHKSSKEITKVATGHTYSEIKTPATCEKDGKIIYDCDNCEYHYTKLLPKLGHRYEETDSKETSCETAGYIVYSCQNGNCEEKRIITIPQLSHEITDTYHQPTCEEDGYMISKCTNCSYEIKVTTGKATGHQFVSKFVWATDYSSAKLVFTCSKNNTHIVEKDAEIEKIITPATCTSNEKFTHIATVNVDGVIYSDTKETFGEKLDHTYLDKWHYNEKMHWKECECSAKDGLENHIFNDGEIIETPTCSKEGEIKYTCECGYEKFEVIAPTYEHTYENGVCTGCGKADDACDHSELTEVKVNLEDYGACKGVFVYKTCACGEVCKAEEEAFSNLICDIETTEESYGTDEDGNMYMIMIGNCTKCGLYLNAKMYAKENGCETFVRQYFTLKMNDILIAENICLEAVYESHISSNKTISLEKYSDCGTTLDVYQCGDCGKITEVIDMNVKCNIEYDQYTGVDENGNNYGVYTMTCQDCGLVFISKFTEEIISNCESIIYNEMTISKENTVIYSCLSEEYNDNHNYEVNYEMLGETCDDGVHVSKKCLNCGEEYSHTSYGHNETTEKYITLSEYGCCEGKIVVEECTVCGTITHLIGSDSSCEMHNEYTEKYLDSNNVEHTLYTNECNICGLKVIEDYYVLEVDGCTVTSDVKFTYKMSDKVIIEFTRLENNDFHDLKYTYVDDDGDCETGYTVIAECLNCGMSYNMQGFGHRYTKEELTFEDKDCCDLSIIYEKCEVCHLESNINNIEVSSNCKFNEIEDKYEDDLGNVHFILIATCETCGLVMKSENYSIKVSPCKNESHYSILITFNNEELFKKEFVETEENHNYKYSYLVDDGKTCDDGYTIIMSCENCGETKTETGFGHVYEYVDEYITKDGTCGITLQISKCNICNHISHVNTENANLECRPENPETDFKSKEIVDDEGITHYVTEFTCVNCQRVYKLDIWAKPIAGCIFEAYQSIQIIDGSEIIFENLSSQTMEEHDLEITYTFHSYDNDCEKGYDVHEKCKNCDYENYYTNYGHNEKCLEDDLSDYGICGGYINKVECDICHKVLRQDIYDHCNWQFMGENEKGEQVSYCENCHTYKSESRVTSEKDENCNYTITYVYYYYLEDGTEILKFERVENIYYNHEYIATGVKLNGTTCEEGYVLYQSCLHCGESREYQGCGHECFKFVLVNLNDYGSCGGIIYKNACPCELYKDIGFEISCKYEENAYKVEEDGIEYNVSDITCKTCGLYISLRSYITIQGCTAFDTKIISVTFNDEVVYSDTFVGSEYAYHTYEYTYNLKGDTCDDGFEKIETCKYCDYYEVYYGSGHELFTDVIYNLEDYNACEGTILINSCPCKEHTEVHYNTTCEFEYNYITEEINGEYYQVRVRTCSKCNLIFKDRDYNYKENCKVYSCNEFSILVGDTYIVEKYISKYYSHEEHNEEITFEMQGESCEDGLILTYTCLDCGLSREEIVNYHYTYIYEHYDLNEYGSCCEGYISFRKCPCGKENYIDKWFNYDNYVTSHYVDENGNYHDVESYTCNGCGLRYEDDTCVVFDKEKCTETKYHNIYLIVGSLGVEKEYSYSYERHTIETTAEFLTSLKNCEDGVTLTNTCKYCDYNYTETYYYHHEYDFEIINLDEHGSVCGGYVVYRACACEKQGRINLEYAICDLDRKTTSMWFDGYISDDSKRPYSAYVYTCAVTDPVQCGIKIRYADYYVRYDHLCYDFRYERWQFGYNDLTGEWDYEIIIEKGEYTEHKYVYNDETIEDENGYVIIESKLCKNCGVGYVYKDYYDNNDLLYKEENFNYSENYDSEYLNIDYYLYEYMYITNSKDEQIRYTTKSYYEYISNNVKQNFTSYTFEYDFTYEAPFGTDSYKVYEHHIDNWGNTQDIEKHITYYEYEYRDRFANYDYFNDKYWYVLYEYYMYNKGTDNEYWNCTERNFRFDIITDYGVKAHEFSKTYTGTNVDAYSITFAEFYYTKEEDTDMDSDWYTLHLYITERMGTDNEYSTYKDFSYDFDYDVPFGVNRHLETLEYRDSDGNDYEESRATSKVISEYGNEHYTYEFYYYYIEFKGTENEKWHRYDYTYSFDTGCKQTTTYTNYLGENTVETIDFHKDLIYGDVIKEPTCTQFGIGSKICVICKFHQEEYEIYPSCHNWLYSYDDYKYHCEDCGLVNINGASGVVVMEDFTEEYGNETHYVVGYYNRNNVEFTYYIALVNPNSDEEIILLDLTFINYDELGIVAMGVSKEEIRLVAEAMGYSVEDYYVKLSFVPIGADNTLDYAITFDKDVESGNEEQGNVYIDNAGQVVVDGIVMGYISENNEIVNEEGNVVGTIDSTGNVFDIDGLLLGNINGDIIYDDNLNFNIA